jgi:hypothetical protein
MKTIGFFLYFLMRQIVKMLFYMGIIAIGKDENAVETYIFQETENEDYDNNNSLVVKTEETNTLDKTLEKIVERIHIEEWNHNHWLAAKKRYCKAKIVSIFSKCIRSIKKK